MVLYRSKPVLWNFCGATGNIWGNSAPFLNRNNSITGRVLYFLNPGKAIQMIRISDSARVFFTVGSIILLVVGMYYLRPILAPISFSFIIAVILLPMAEFFERRGLSTDMASLITVSLMSLVFAGVVFAATWQASEFTDSIMEAGPKLEQKIQHVIIAIEKEHPQIKKQKLLNYRQRTQDLFKKMADHIGETTSGIASFVANILFLPLFVYFLLSYRHFFRYFLHNVFKSKHHYVDDVVMKIHGVTQSYLQGMLMVMGIVAVLNSIGLLIIGVPYAIAFAVLASLLMVVPYLGVFVGSLLPFLMALFTFNTPLPALAVAAWMWGVQIIEGNFITPKIVGSKVSINPLAAVISLMVMGKLWGIAGMVVAIPFVAILKIIFDAVPSTRPYGMLLGEVEEKFQYSSRKKQKTDLKEQISKTDKRVAMSEN